MVQDKIYQYFERDPELKVLFIFNNEFLAAELADVEWRTGYRYVDFQGDWFTVSPVTLLLLDTCTINDTLFHLCLIPFSNRD